MADNGVKRYKGARVQECRAASPRRIFAQLFNPIGQGSLILLLLRATTETIRWRLMVLNRRVLFVAVLLAACGSDESDETTPPPPPGFAGTYATQVTLVQNSCGSVTVQSLPTTVTHNATSGALTLVHGGTTFVGTVAADSTFNTTPRDVDTGDGFQYRVAIAGRFGNRSFVADATVDRSGAGVSCRYVAHWVGSR